MLRFNKKKKGKSQYRVGLKKIRKKNVNNRSLGGKRQVKINEDKVGKRKRYVRKEVEGKKTVRKVNWKKIGVFILWICFLFGVGWVLCFSGVLRIKKIQIESLGETNDDVAVVRMIVEDEISKLKQEMLWEKVSLDNIILFPKERLGRVLEKRDVRIKKAIVEKKFPDTLIVKIKPRRGLLVWRFNDECLVSDFVGQIIYSCDLRDDNEKNFLNICRQERMENGLSCQVVKVNANNSTLTNRERHALASLIERIFNELKKTVFFDEKVFFEIPKVDAGEIIVYNGRGNKILFSVSDNWRQEIDKLRLFLEKKISGEDLKKIDYIDLRIGDKVIYREKR